MIQGYYLEEIRVRNGNKLFYKDTSKLEFVSSYYITGIPPELVVSVDKRRRKDVQTYKVNEIGHGNIIRISNAMMSNDFLKSFCRIYINSFIFCPHHVC